MSSVSNNPSSSIPQDAKYNQQQTDDLKKLDEAPEKIANAVASGNKEAIKQARSELKELYKQAAKDGISKDIIKEAKIQTHQAGVASYIGTRKKSGKDIDDTAAAGTLRNDFESFAKKHGLDLKSPDTFNAWEEQITPDLKKAGLTDAEISKSLQAAQDYKPTDAVKKFFEIRG